MTVDYYEYIEDYLTDKLNEQDRSDFEAAMVSDTDLKQAVENFSLIKESLEAAVQEEARTALKNMKGVKKGTGMIYVIGKNRKTMVRAASFLLIILAGMFGYAHLEYQPVGLADKYYQKPADLTEQGSTILEELLEEEETVTTVEDKYLLAHKFMEINDFERALNYFNEVVSANDERFSMDAEYNAALCLIYLNRKEEALGSLSGIIKSKGHSKAGHATALYNKLTGFWSKLVLK